MKTKTIGEILKEEREFHRLSLEELAKRTRIRPEYLQALESNNFEALPAATFVRGYIKTYGKTFGFDYQPLIGLLRRDFKESAKGTLVPREFIKPMLRKGFTWTPITSLIVLVGAGFLTLTLYIGYQWYAFNRPPMLEVYNPVDNQNVASEVDVEGITVPDAIVSVNTQPVAIQADGTFATRIFLPREGITSITIEAKDRRNKSSIIQRTVYVQF
ncbi:MAG: helix-turn-helix domain-containing protein [bacterium]|nr:helix-turn-helix domain-containing protein [bacterium]